MDTIARKHRYVVEANPRSLTPAGGQSLFLLASMREATSSPILTWMRPGPGAGSLRILIVDDSRHFLDAARSTLEQDGLTVVGVAATGAEARRLARELRPDGILVDIDLGDESGLDLARQLTSLGVTPVVLISAYPESELTDLIAASPAIGFVSKSELSGSAISSLIVPSGPRGT